MRSTTLDTIPASHSKLCDTFRASEITTLGAGLGCPSLIDFDEHGSVPPGQLVAEHVPEGRPSCIEHGFSHPCLSEFGGAHIADRDQTVLSRQSGALDVQLVPARIGDLGVDRSGAGLAAGALRLGQRRLVAAIVAQRRYLAAVAARRQRGKAKIDADLAVAGRQIVRNLACESGVPASARVRDESTGEKAPFDWPVQPKPIPALEIGQITLTYLDGARDVRNPSEGALCAKTGAEARTAAVCVARGDELPADCVYGVAVQPKIGGTSSAELNQVEGAGPARFHPALVAALRLALRGDAEVPDLIGGNGKLIKTLPARPVLDPEAVSNYAHCRAALPPVRMWVKSASFGCNRAARSHFILETPDNFNMERAFLCRLKAAVSCTGTP